MANVLLDQIGSEMETLINELRGLPVDDPGYEDRMSALGRLSDMYVRLQSEATKEQTRIDAQKHNEEELKSKARDQELKEKELDIREKTRVDDVWNKEEELKSKAREQDIRIQEDASETARKKLELELKEKELLLEDYRAEKERALKEKELQEAEAGRKCQGWLTAASIIVPGVLGLILAGKAFKFEETGTFSSHAVTWAQQITRLFRR